MWLDTHAAGELHAPTGLEALRCQRPDRCDGKFKRPPVVDPTDGLLPDLSRLHPLHQAIERAELRRIAGHPVSLKIDGTRPWDVEVRLLQAPGVERAGADNGLDHVLYLDNAAIPELDRYRYWDPYTVVAKLLLVRIQFLSTDIGQHA